MRKEINDLKDIPLDRISWEDISTQANTGRETSVGRGRNKVFSYRLGVKTRIGDIELSVWIAAVEYMAKIHDEEQILTALKQWYLDTAAWCRHNPNEAHRSALDALCSGLFNNKKWVGYEEFNSKYRPHSLKGENAK